MTLAYTGGRHEEVMGLCVEDVNFELKAIGFYHNTFRRLKRDHCERDVILWPALALVLRHYLERTQRTTGLLFPSRTGRMRPSIRKLFARCVSRAGLTHAQPVTPHTLRHTYATALLQTLVPLPNGEFAVRNTFDVSKALGHKDTLLVDSIYGHVARRPRYMKTLSFEEGRTHPATRLNSSLAEEYR